MSDLVERLRTSWDVDRSIISQTSRWDRERKEAADEITALRARLDAAEKERDEAKESARWAYIDGCLDGDDDIVLARAERAEAALATARQLANDAIQMCEDGYPVSAYNVARQVIRALANEAPE